ncbi:MAG: calcium/sodium antiporter [Euryarchaeota archaeon]|nr:calcium/sodium antiporter [Euryarchaeota archaeon]
MPLAIDLALFALGIPLLWGASVILVRGAAAIARRLGLSSFLIGLTVVSFGTSAPELFVNGLAALRGETALAMGTILGSNVSNVLLVLGAAALFTPLRVESDTVRLEIPFTLIATLAVAVLANDALVDGGRSILDRSDALLLLAFFVLFLTYAMLRVRDGSSVETVVHPLSLPRALLFLGGGLVGLAIASDWLVSGATLLGPLIGIPDAVTGFVVLALGTSLPELAASIAAARAGQRDMAVGNVVGSNLFNLLLILGVTALITPIPLVTSANLHLGAALVANLLLLPFLITGLTLRAWEGWVLIASYVTYAGWLVLH